MSTTRFCALIDMPERTWRRWQARARAGPSAKGPWPRPARDRPAATHHALAHPTWGHRKIWALARYDGHVVSASTVLPYLQPIRASPKPGQNLDNFTSDEATGLKPKHRGRQCNRRSIAKKGSTRWGRSDPS